MTGAEHYAQAEHLLAEGRRIAQTLNDRITTTGIRPSEFDAAVATVTMLIGFAQAHATLALAAATAATVPSEDPQGASNDIVIEEWHKAGAW